ncbi:peptide deformylase [Amphritea sp. 2_MG-2023]|jgi:peptide deformylase|uniref:peptide deformylase n=1 Tax=Amphritea TaxID=515417 RepID=UPI001C07D744|nr:MULTISPECIES: peptide deformylase [Amphritea]MBU2966197.1 peptide deformylase [Amphritea atlantica]MDO6417041.1 peptide deformylase [Amphritea sp. 2_MG-2023]MDX2421164.1 peptide deformylase [Amphritea sp.]
MSLLPILEFPDPRLRTIAEPVTEFNDELRQLVKDMFETMYDAPGIGLAATQVNVHQRIITIDTSEEKDNPLVVINPQIEVLAEETERMQEGCLSVPGFYEDVVRPNKIRLTAQNELGEEYVLEADDLLAVCIQHEIDHLEGKLFVDYLSPLKRSRIRSKLDKLHRQKV